MTTVRDLCAIRSLPHSCDDAWGGDVIAAACVHLASTVEPRRFEGAWIAQEYIDGHYDAADPVVIQAGHIRVPQKPGLGVKPEKPGLARLSPPMAPDECALQQPCGHGFGRTQRPHAGRVDTGHHGIGIARFSHLALHAYLEPLHIANVLSKTPLFRWRVAGMDNEAVPGANGLAIPVDITIEALNARSAGGADIDELVIVAGEAVDIQFSPILYGFLRCVARHGTGICAIGTATFDESIVCMRAAKGLAKDSFLNEYGLYVRCTALPDAQWRRPDCRMAAKAPGRAGQGGNHPTIEPA